MTDATNCSEGLVARLKSATEGILWADVNYDELPEAEKDCPRCGKDTLHVDHGLAVSVYRCSNCRLEGGGR